MAGCGEFAKTLAQQEKLKKQNKLSKAEKLLQRQIDQQDTTSYDPWGYPKDTQVQSDTSQDKER